MYRKWVKRLLDILLSGAALVVLCIPMGVIALWIKLDSPGPVLFRQKRVGKNKVLFDILKFRTMRTDTPHDMPTHMLKNPDAFITKSGHFLRKTSRDELPQRWTLCGGQGKYGANDVAPGRTCWAQVNGRDGLEIPVKARLDGEYVQHLGFAMDVKCFLRTITSVLGHEGVVEGGTGALHEAEQQKNQTK